MKLLRTLSHLLPRARAFRLLVGKQLRQLVEGLAEEPDAIRGFHDDVYDDLFPATTRELERWETQFALQVADTEADRRQNLAAAWQAQGGQSPKYLQDVVQAAGFDLYVHEWWSSGPDPYVARDPRNYTEDPLIGTVQCGEPLAQCGETSALCNNFLANYTFYLVNDTLLPIAPPPVPSDPVYWPYFLYFGGATFGDPATVPLSRRDELEQLLLRICPAQQWIVLIVTFVEGAELRETLDEDARETLDGTARETLDLF